ncbi:MAG: hypothetical protein JWQ95_5018 [Sphaerisporangium sp.]|jgi:hypothetical protein|nr:hypothetical protein [Sphaerisporangium sp.]
MCPGTPTTGAATTPPTKHPASSSTTSASLFTLDTLLNLDGGVRPEMIATDNASYSGCWDHFRRIER